VGVVTNRRAWHNPELLTREVLAHYKRPLRVQGWDAALLATSRAASSLSQKQVLGQFAAVRTLPALLVTGEHDRIATPGKVTGLQALLPRSRRAVVPACGHLSHEEAPLQLLELLVPFCASRIAKAAAKGGGGFDGSPTAAAAGRLSPRRPGRDVPSRSPTRFGGTGVS
jgi:pimeloyl-ACP methyl ester carboxylesterase